MKLLRYGPAGQEQPGLLDSEGSIRDLSSVIDDIAGDALTPGKLQRLSALDISRLPVVAPGTRLGPCVGRAGKFICIGLNYSDHAAESGMPLPAEPVVFGKWTSAMIGPNDEIEIPRDSLKTDWEVELGVVIGKPGRYIEEADALTHVAGYCVIHDVSEREFQLERGGTWDKGKGCDTFGPTGPWLVTADEIADPHALGLWLEVDGRRYQNGSTVQHDLPHSVPHQLPQLLHEPALRRCDFHRNACRSRPRSKTSDFSARRQRDPPWHRWSRRTASGLPERGLILSQCTFISALLPCGTRLPVLHPWHENRLSSAFLAL